ncbi:MAG: protein kinase [Polyangiaceae bacterium]|nr:protein kinase [Polyangiaceae bacterium]
MIAIHGLGHDGKRHFLAMEVLRGHTLLETWEVARARATRLPREVVAWIGARVADGLHHAHELRDDGGKLAQVVHRDVNPANVFLTREGIPKIIDFGLAKARDRITSTAVGIIKGKLAYLAPEQAHGHAIDRRVDVFALGVTLWELTLDRRLFKESDDVETLRRVREASAPDPTSIDPNYPPALARVLMRALARDPATRFATAKELRDALDGVVAQGPRVDAARVRELLAQLFAGAPRAAWERFVDEASGPVVRAWDDEAHKPTWVNAPFDERPPLEDPGTLALPDALDVTADGAAPLSRHDRFDAALAGRLAALDDGGDALTRARTHLERAVVEEALGDPARAAVHARASIDAWPTAAAHGALRRLSPGHPSSRSTKRNRQPALPAVGHIDAEIAAAASDAVRADLLAERARLLEASGAPAADVRAAWLRAVEARPGPAALHGLEGALSASPDDGDALAEHRGRLADACAGDPPLAAFWHVERARALDARGRSDAAKGALLRALELDPGTGSTGRAACEAHAAAHRDGEWLAALLVERARRLQESAEADSGQVAALWVDAACIARYRLGDLDRAVDWFERAALLTVQAPAESSAIARRALDELCTLHEAAGRVPDALRARRARLSYIASGPARAHELRAIASLEEALGDPKGAVISLERALEASPGDLVIAETLDRLLATVGRPTSRIDLWARLAEHARDPQERARLRMRAARVAEAAGDPTRAALHARAALVADPAQLEAVEALLRLHHEPLPEAARLAARERIAVHAHAADHAPDRHRRTAHLLAVAILAEDCLGDAPSAMATYETIVRIEPTHAAALAGLARTAARCGDAGRRATALLGEAACSRDEAAADGLRVHAAQALAASDPDRALALAEDVLARRPDHVEALDVVQTAHAAAGRWARVDATLAARIEATAASDARADLWLARAEVQRARLRSPAAAQASIRAALAIAPSHAGARLGLATSAEGTDEPASSIEVLEELARTTADPVERVRLLARASDIAEHVLRDDTRAAALGARAVAEAPGALWLEERTLRTLRRVAAGGDARPLVKALTSRLARDPNDVRAFLELGALHLAAGNAAGALDCARGAVGLGDSSPEALHLLERAARAAGHVDALVEALTAQADAFTAPAGCLGALWKLAPVLDAAGRAAAFRATVERISAESPDDRAAADLVLRASWPEVRSGDDADLPVLLRALDLRRRLACDDTERLWALLAIALVRRDDGSPSQATGGGSGAQPIPERRDEETRAALDACREALRIDRTSVVAALETARLAAELHDDEAAVAAALARADLVTDDRHRAAFLVHAAGKTLAAPDERFGTRPERLARAGELLERALTCDPEAISAVGLLAAVRSEDGGRGRLVAALRRAFERAQSTRVVGTLGLELARVASQEPADRVLAIDALRRVLALEPEHPPTLRALADQYRAQGATAEAADALERLAVHAREPGARVAALSELADLYAAAPGSSDDVVRVLNQVLDINPLSVPTRRRLIDVRETAGAPAEEIADLLARLAESETTPEAKADALVRLADVRRTVVDLGGAERALVEANAQCPSPRRLAALLELHEGEPAAQARALSTLVARSQLLGTPDAGCHATLGKLEGQVLGRWADAAPHLRVALTLSPAMHEVRAALAEALVHTGAPGEAAGVILSMMSPDAAPLVALSDPSAAFRTFEAALMAHGHREEALVARELRALAGGVDDAAHAELRGRRLSFDPAAPATTSLDAAILRQHVVPDGAPAVCLDLAAGLLGVERKLVRTTLEDLRGDPRDRLPTASGHPLLWVVHRIATSLGLPRPEVVTVGSLAVPRITAAQDALWIAIPQTLLGQPEPVQAATVARPLVRMALGVPWLEDGSAAATCAILHAVGRQAVPGYGAAEGTEMQALVEEASRRVARLVGRPQKKALGVLAQTLAARPAPTLDEVEAFMRAVAVAELRAAFVLTGDLLATLDVVRATDPGLAAATASAGNGALRAMLLHPLASDTARFALLPQTTALRWRAGTLWRTTRERALSSPPPRR